MNHGRWVVDCPREGCGWAYFAMTPDGRPRYQHACVGGRDLLGRPLHEPGCGIRIDLCWPPLDVALEVERILHARPAPATRNWRPPETVETLLRENQAALVGWTLEQLVEQGIGVA